MLVVTKTSYQADTGSKETTKKEREKQRKKGKRDLLFTFLSKKTLLFAAVSRTKISLKAWKNTRKE